MANGAVIRKGALNRAATGRIRRKAPFHEPPTLGEVVPGLRAISALLNARKRRLRSLYVARGEREEKILDLVNTAEAARARIIWDSQESISRRFGLLKGERLVGVADPLPVAGIRDLRRLRPAKGSSPVLLLDHVEDPRNLGAIFRVAACFGVTAVVLPARRTAPLSPAAMKAAAGGVEYVDTYIVPNVAEALRALVSAGFSVFGLSRPGDLKLGRETSLPDKGMLALVVGSEGKGLSKAVRDQCTALLEIPQKDSPESLNVSTACAVALYELCAARS